MSQLCFSGRLVCSFFLLIAYFSSTSALAQSSENKSFAHAIPCTCSAYGRTYQIGDEICIKTYKGMERMRCGMVLNNTAWQPIDEACMPVSESHPLSLKTFVSTKSSTYRSLFLFNLTEF